MSEQVDLDPLEVLEGTAVKEFAKQLTEEGFKVIITVDPDISKYDIEEKDVMLDQIRSQ